MDRKKLFIGLGLVLLFVLVVGGVVMYLRSRNLPLDGAVPRQSGSVPSRSEVSPKLAPYQKIEDVPKSPSYVPGQTPPPIEENLRTPTLE